jgi:hypothetical protein
MITYNDTITTNKFKSDKRFEMKSKELVYALSSKFKCVPIPVIFSETFNYEKHFKELSLTEVLPSQIQ